MSNENAGLSDYERARLEYRELLQRYGHALSAKDPGARELFAQATVAWGSLRAFGIEPESAVGDDMHLVGALSFAAQAGDAAEAERLYNAMGDDYRDATDTAEALNPGSIKIWLR